MIEKIIELMKSHNWEYQFTTTSCQWRKENGKHIKIMMLLSELTSADAEELLKKYGRI